MSSADFLHKGENRASDNLALRVSLTGMQLIQASAGTGKTFTLAGIYTRLIVELRLSVRQILVVTFTRAATEELKSRLRARLVLCADVAAGLHQSDDMLAPELAQSRALVAAALNAETALALQSRLRLAALELDSAQISTIHGFCQRALREHTFDAQAASDGELVASDRDLIATIAADLWREHAVAQDAEAFNAFVAVVGNANHFADLLPRLLDVRTELQPQPQLDSDQARATIQAAQAACATLAQIWREHGELAFSALSAHAQAGNIDARSYPLKNIQRDADIFSHLFADGDALPHDLLARYTTTQLDAKLNKDKPALPRQIFFNAIANTLPVLQPVSIAQRELGLQLLRTSIAEARQRLDAIKRATRRYAYDDLIQRLHAALSDAQDDDLAHALHEQYPYALVDEFQDTDAQQFAIFAAIYRARGALFLIGDPKQAIYRFRGGDVHTYLVARMRADGEYSLNTNFRSTPAYLRALQRLYTFSGAAAFADPRIRFEPVRSGDKTADDDLLIDGHAATPLTIWQVDDEVGNKADAVQRLAQGCAAAILNLLIRARNGRAQLRVTLADGERGYRALKPGDLAVLVSEHRHAGAMQAALSALRIPSVALSKRSVFATDEARELHGLLDALVELDEARLRTVLASVLFGNTLADFVKFADASDAGGAELLRAQLIEFATLQRIWIEHGVLAMFERVFEYQAPRLLALEYGERRMTNWLQLADLAQTASAQTVGLRGLTDWLATRIARADDNNEDEQLRLESDADRVQIRTVYASKGLEYPIVFLPFAALGRSEQNKYPKLLRFHADHNVSNNHNNAGGESAAYLITDKAAAEQPVALAARAHADAEDLAERLRVLYVGLTRARQACFVATGIFGKDGTSSALLHLLGADAEKKGVGKNADDQRATILAQRLRELSADGFDAILITGLPEAADRFWQAQSQPALGSARQATRKIIERRGMYSFSRLAAGAHDVERVGEERAGVDDERGGSETVTADPTFEVPLDMPAILRGARFGTAFHEILEKADFAAWRDWRARVPPAHQRDLIEHALQRHALLGARGDEFRTPQDSAIVAAVTQLVAATLNSPQPFGARLCDLAANQRRAEMPFHFAMDNADASRWLQTMHAHGYLRARSRFALDAQRLAGLMTGVLDLVVLHNNRWWVIDYKTNLISASGSQTTGVDASATNESNSYAPTRLARAVADSEYDLQYLIYLVALHRWLKSRLGSQYDYARDIGGALYLFVRGMDAGGMNGIHVDKPPLALIDALDDLFAAPRENVA